MTRRLLSNSHFVMEACLSEQCGVNDALAFTGWKECNTCGVSHVVGQPTSMMQSDAFHILQGIYLLLERLKFPVYRRLFKRVQLLHAEENPAKAAQLPLGVSSL